MRRALARAGVAPGARLLDVGCGHGWYVAELRRRGYEVVGIDAAVAQVMAATSATAPPAAPWAAPLAAASALALPFAASSFDAAYAVNVLHHVDTAQRHAALGEIVRAVRPGGLVFVHEINTVNPLYRFYMSYVFPLWKRIDLGTEVWLDPHALPVVPGLEATSVEYFTFLPDFTPPPVYSLLAALERRLERSRLAPYSAHFTAVYRRSDHPAPTTPVTPPLLPGTRALRRPRPLPA
jgi:SAM-dependent methyltransferase